MNNISSPNLPDKSMEHIDTWVTTSHGKSYHLIVKNLPKGMHSISKEELKAIVNMILTKNPEKGREKKFTFHISNGSFGYISLVKILDLTEKKGANRITFTLETDPDEGQTSLKDRGTHFIKDHFPAPKENEVPPPKKAIKESKPSQANPAVKARQ